MHHTNRCFRDRKTDLLIVWIVIKIHFFFQGLSKTHGLKPSLVAQVMVTSISKSIKAKSYSTLIYHPPKFSLSHEKKRVFLFSLSKHLHSNLIVVQSLHPSVSRVSFCTVGFLHIRFTSSDPTSASVKSAPVRSAPSKEDPVMIALKKLVFLILALEKSTRSTTALEKSTPCSHSTSWYSSKDKSQQPETKRRPEFKAQTSKFADTAQALLIITSDRFASLKFVFSIIAPLNVFAVRSLLCVGKMLEYIHILFSLLPGRYDFLFTIQILASQTKPIKLEKNTSHLPHSCIP